jgi:predicted RNA-binding protein with PIN domain
MATHLLVDGYNLVGQPPEWRGPAGFGRLEGARETLVSKNLAGYRQRKGHAITVVFDGWQGGLGSGTS